MVTHNHRPVPPSARTQVLTIYKSYAGERICHCCFKRTIEFEDGELGTPRVVSTSLNLKRLAKEGGKSGAKAKLDLKKSSLSVHRSAGMFSVMYLRCAMRGRMEG